MARLGALLDTAGLEQIIKPSDWIAVKIEVGELGHLGYLRPPLVRAIAEKVISLGGEPMIVDTTRLNTVGSKVNWTWLEATAANGFALPVIGREPILADGYTGEEYELLPVEGDELGGLEVARSIAEAKAVIVVSHVTAHPFAGLSGALTSMGLGSSARRGKWRIHEPLQPMVLQDRCNGCGLCVEHCLKNALTLSDNTLNIDKQLCAGCAYYCTASCPRGALAIDSEAARHFQRRIVEAAGAVHVAALGKLHFLNFLFDVGPYPDYYPFSDVAIVPDLGVISGRDPVAVDQATLDLIDATAGIACSMAEEAEALAPGRGKLYRITGVNPESMLEYAQKFGLGTRSYELVRLQA
jgi:hypothetical protein